MVEVQEVWFQRPMNLRHRSEKKFKEEKISIVEIVVGIHIDEHI